MVIYANPRGSQGYGEAFTRAVIRDWGGGDFADVMAALDEAILRNWIVNNSRRDAFQRVAHLLCEVHARVQMIGLADSGRLDLPLTQDELADASGLTAVHINRTLQRLRREDLITLSGKVLTIKNAAELKRVAGFDGNYLHIRRRTP